MKQDMTQKKKQLFEPPVILHEVRLEPSESLLAGSVVTKETKIETAGQQVETKSFDATGFNTTWE